MENKKELKVYPSEPATKWISYDTGHLYSFWRYLIEECCTEEETIERFKFENRHNGTKLDKFPYSKYIQRVYDDEEKKKEELKSRTKHVYNHGYEYIDLLRLNEEKELFWDIEELPTDLTPSIEDIIKDHEHDKILKSKYNKFVHIVANTEEYCKFLTNDNQFGKALSWCRCLLMKEDKGFTHEHWHILFRFNFNYKYSVWFNSRSLSNYSTRFTKPDEIKLLFKTIRVCQCSSELNGIIHYMGCATGQQNKHLHLDRNSSWLHKRSTVELNMSYCQLVMKDIEKAYNLEYHCHTDVKCECKCVKDYNYKITRDQIIKQTRRENGILYRNHTKIEHGPQPNPIKITALINSKLQQYKNTI